MSYLDCIRNISNGTWHKVMILIEDTFSIAQAEAEYQELFKHFCKSLAVESRKNPKLQMNMLPLRFRKYMVEFD